MPRLTDAQFAEALGLYESGLSLEAIAERLPITRQALWQRMKTAGVEFRPQKRHGDENHFYRGGAVGEDWATNRMEKAILRGDLTRPDTCSECGGKGKPYKDGRAPIQGHHDDYNRPLDVRWLCQKCHHEWHKHNTAIPLDAEPAGGDAPGTLFDLAPVDAIVGGFPKGRAKATAPPDAVMALLIQRLLCGPSSLESFARFNPRSSSSKTWLTPSLSMTAPSGEPFSGTWPRSAMTWRGRAFELVTSVPLISATESSPLLPTPRASLNELRSIKRTPSQEAGAHGKYLSSEAMALLPTPRERDWKGSGFEDQLPNVIKLLPTPRARVDKEHGTEGKHWSELRPTVEALKLLPTPEASDATGGRVSKTKGGRRPSGAKKAITLATAIHHQPGGSQSSGATTSPPSADGKPSTGLRLNPSFVGWMMGAPSCNECGREWTDSDCPHSATAFTSTSAGSSAMPSTNSNGGGEALADA